LKCGPLIRCRHCATCAASAQVAVGAGIVSSPVLNSGGSSTSSHNGERRHLTIAQHFDARQILAQQFHQRLVDENSPPRPAPPE
jgi:hypothetical protein